MAKYLTCVFLDAQDDETTLMEEEELAKAESDDTIDEVNKLENLSFRCFYCSYRENYQER